MCADDPCAVKGQAALCYTRTPHDPTANGGKRRDIGLLLPNLTEEVGQAEQQTSPHVQNWLVDPRVVVSSLGQQSVPRASAESIKPCKHQTLLCPDSLPYEMQQLTRAGREMRDAAARTRRDRGRDAHRAGTAPNLHRGSRQISVRCPEHSRASPPRRAS